LEHRQGVTPGGALDVFLISAPAAKAARIETALARTAFKSKGVQPWSIPSQGLVLVFPYSVEGADVRPAFAIKNPKLRDSLDFDVVLDNWEATRRNAGGDWVMDILERRIAQNLVAFPNAARYLARHYDKLQARSFEHKNIREHGRRWYEYWRPRGVEVLESIPRLVSPSLIKGGARFALESKGRLSDHAAVFLVRTKRTQKRFDELRRHLTRVLSTAISDKDVFLYLLDQLNTEYAVSVMVRGRNPTAKGYYPVNESFLDELMVDGTPTASAAREALDRSRAELANGGNS
jgi:hypothetical protein